MRLLLAAETSAATVGFWTVVGLIVTGLLGFVGDWTRKRYGWGPAKEGLPESSEKVAADTAARELLTWIEEHTLKPMRRDLARMAERADRLQVLIDKRQSELAEARATIRELRAQILFMEGQLTVRQEQIAVLLLQLGASHVRTERPDQPGPD